MLLYIIYMIFSFVIEGFMTSFFTSTFSNMSYFTTIYTIVALVVIYKYFYNDKKYFIIVGIFGLLFDFLYTGTIFINIIIFLLTAIVIKTFSNILNDNIIMTNIISLIAIITYHILSFVILSIIGYADYSLLLLGKIIIHSIIMTFIYTTISYYLIEILFNKFELKGIK